MSFKYKFDCGSKTSFYVNHDNNVVDTYFNEIRRYPVLSEEEEYQLFIQLKNGTTEKERQEAKEKLINCNLRFVISIAKKLGTPETFCDLVSEGNIGLIKAIEKYNADKECHLITYALSWIVAYINNYLITQLNPVVPPNALKIHNYVRNVVRDFYAENERNPTTHEIADLVRKKFNFNISNLEDIELGRSISIDEKYSVLDDDDTVEETLFYVEKTSTNNIQENIDEEYKKHKLDFFLGKLNERERYIVEHHYGINCIQESFDTIGMKLDLGGERVRQICNVAVGKMRQFKKMVNE